MDAARGIAISLVIFCHVIEAAWNAGMVARGGWWGDLLLFVYTFHMPVFMFLSGLFVSRRLQGGCGAFLRSTTVNVLWPYVVWGVVALVAEQLGKGLRSDVDTSALDLSLLWKPIAWLWFLWALAACQVLAAALHKRPWALLALGLVVLPFGDCFGASTFPRQISHFLAFYALGVLVGPRLARSSLTPTPMLGAAGLLGALALSAPLMLATDWHAAAWSFASVPAGICGAAGLIVLAMQPAVAGNRLLQFLGRRSLPLYINHIFFMAAARIALTHFLGITAFFPVVFTACLAAAYIGPLALYELASRFGATQWLGLGKGVRQHGQQLPHASPASRRPLRRRLHGQADDHRLPVRL